MALGSDLRGYDPNEIRAAGRASCAGALARAVEAAGHVALIGEPGDRGDVGEREAFGGLSLYDAVVVVRRIVPDERSAPATGRRVSWWRMTHGHAVDV